MKNKKNTRSPAKLNPSAQPRPSPPPSYTFVPPTIPFYPPPPPLPPWSAFPGAWPGPPPLPPPGYQTAIPPSANGPLLANLPPNAAPGRLAAHSLSHPPFGLWPPPGAYPPPPMMMGAVMPPTNAAQASVVPPISAHGLVMQPTPTTQGAVVPPTSIHETIVNAPVDGPSRAAPPLRKRPITRRSAAQDQAAANASAGQSLEPALPSLTASKGSLTRRVKSHKHKDKEEHIHVDQDNLEANAAVVDESIPSDVKDSSNEEISTAETSGREDNNASLPKLGSEPYVGFRFSSEDEAYEFYNAYAKEKGFGIRKSHIQRSRVDRSVISREYVCANQGFRSTNDRRYKGKVVRPRRETRVDCRAAMSIKRRSGKWVVDKFHKEHNHGLVDPAKAEKLRSHRKITHTTKSVIDTLYKCRIGPSKIIDVLTKAAAGENKVEISGLDLLKYVKKKRKNNIAVDLYSVLEYFQGMQAVDPGFFYAVEVGENRSMRSIFWADSRAREAYKQFGDVLVFDAICGANKDLFPFVSFIGVNHHRQPVLFGCGLMADETAESFVWLFETLLRSMSNRHPISVITKQDTAILVAIEKVFPKTRQRFCMCQIEKSELENLSHVFNMHTDFQDEYKKCIYNSRKPEEFESSWKELFVKYNLKGNNWLNGMYDQRQHWVPLYLRDTFFAGMTTTHLTEGVNSYFDGFLHEGTLLNEFLRQYQQAVERRREEETDEDFMTMYTSAGSTSKNPIEEQAAKAYTRNMFTMFGHEFFESSGCISRRISEKSNISKYLVGKYSDKDDDMSVVTFNSIDSSANCSCQMFEFEGLLCSHVLKAFQELNIIEIPSKYILKRWTMSARYSGSCNDEAEGVSEDPTTVDAWTLKETAVRFVEFGVISTERVNVALNIIEEGMKKIALVNVPVDDLPSENLGDLPSENLGSDRLQEEWINDTTSCDPQPFNTKDCHTSLKTKLGVKPSPKKKRKCSTCKKTGHYTSTCPKGPVDPSETSTNAAGTC